MSNRAWAKAAITCNTAIQGAVWPNVHHRALVSSSRFTKEAKQSQWTEVMLHNIES